MMHIGVKQGVTIRHNAYMTFPKNKIATPQIIDMSRVLPIVFS